MIDTNFPPPVMMLREFAGWLRRPHRLDPMGLRAPGALRRLTVLTALMVAGLLLVLLPVLGLWQSLFSLPTPDAFGKLEPRLMIPIVLLAAPVLEEMLFRGWLTGRVRALWLLGCALAFSALLYGSTQGLNPLAVGACFLALLVAAPLGWFLLRRKGTPPWFDMGFGMIFYLSAGCFALVHMANYPSFSALALPLVLPQLWAGLVLGFIRMRIGLVASMLAHALSNSAALTVALLAS
ncbi:MAG TPA: CPBP family intramembrane glutamic endopeptidase [Sphingomonadaceae bacterium]|nr:CPBP family intramembrane glutamic endopeptidase [Sphingomonadaceae bacterium]